MAFEIKLTQTDSTAIGEITLGEHRETFIPDLTHFTADQYRAQWKRALTRAVVHRESAALFQSLEIDNSGFGTLWLYPLVPSEDAKLNKDADGIYVTERFMPIVIDPHLLLERRFHQQDDGTNGPEIMSNFLDMTAPDRFFGYLDDTVSGISHWYYSNGNFPV